MIQIPEIKTCRRKRLHSPFAAPTDTVRYDSDILNRTFTKLLLEEFAEVALAEACSKLGAKY